MSILITCPQCQARFEIPDDLADQPVRCHHCLHTFERVEAPGSESVAAGIQIAAAPVAKTAAPRARERPIESAPPPRMPQPFVPFPWNSVFLIIIGILFLLLVMSAGFNFWILANPEQRGRRIEEIRAMEMEAQAQRDRAEAAAQMARQQELIAQENWNKLRRENEELKREVKNLRMHLAEANRAQPKLP